MTDEPNNLHHKTVAQAADYLTGLVEDGCTGHVEGVDAGRVYIYHDGDTCPIHETGEPRAA
jgi:hypothetical protein